jgi:uncharacterized tellurite resistance protein B-like protein
MLNTLNRFFNKITMEDSSDPEKNAEHDIRIATCALFLEMARIDESFTQEETATILSILRDKYGLSQEHADALIAAADEELKDSIDYWQFARLINENYSTEEKIEIIETLWRIIYVDGKLDKYEDHLIHKLSTLLRLSHDQLIHAKLKVLHST